MGRIVDLFSEVASEADIGIEGVVLPRDAYERLREDWEEEDIEDALKLVHENLLQTELAESADSLSASLLDVLGEYGSTGGFQRAQEGGAVLSLDVIGQLARRLARLEEVLDSFRDGPPPDRSTFESLRRRLMDVGIEEEMTADDDVAFLPEHAEEQDDEEDNG
jgi:hypothetical protein